MLIHILPVFIMFLYTVLTASLFFIPITRFPRKTKLFNFYWVGFWGFLVAIAALAGADNVLRVGGYDATKTSMLVLTTVSAGFVLFVVVAWFHLSAKAIASIYMRGRDKLKSKLTAS